MFSLYHKTLRFGKFICWSRVWKSLMNQRSRIEILMVDNGPTKLRQEFGEEWPLRRCCAELEQSHREYVEVFEV